MTDRKGESEAERRGRERADAAHDRLKHALERARRARQEAATAGTPEGGETYRREAKLHDAAARLQTDAENLQPAHIEEAREGQFDGREGRGNDDAPDRGEDSSATAETRP